MLQCGHDPKAVENLISGSIVATWTSCFNAATTRRPWRTAPLDRSRPTRLACFNAATTRRPWRTPPSWYSPTLHSRLQCGHDPKAVENERASVPGTGARELQCGHDPKAVENVGAVVLIANNLKLQCGHDPKAVENGSIVGRLAYTDLLQCGHDPKAVENVMRRPSPRRRPPQSFNAATTRRPWRTCSRSQGEEPGASGSCFNAATTRRPWRTAGRRVAVVQYLSASMRPRPEGRGERRWLYGGSAPASVGFNAATTRRPWRTATLELPRPDRRTGVAAADAATTRRPWRTAGEGLRFYRVRAASMRPRPEGRGELAALLRQAYERAKLQCGHDPKAVENVVDLNARVEDARSFNAATTRRPWRTGGSRPRQAGHGECFNAATTRRPWRTPTYCGTTDGETSFNAATTRRPWRTANLSCCSLETSTPLQCGHGHKAVENRPRPPLRFRRRSAASMRPRPEGRGELAPAGPGPPADGRFNAATTRRPWRTDAA